MRVMVRLYDEVDLSDEEFIEMEVEVPERFYKAASEDRLKRFDLGPFVPGGQVYTLRTIDHSEGEPILLLGPRLQ